MNVCKGVLILFGALVVLGCTGTKKTAYGKDELYSFKKFIEQRSFEFIANSANPIPSRGMTAVANSGLLPPGSTMSNIPLQGNSNYLKVEGDTLSAYLPYFGERQSGGGYNSDAGIKFDGIPASYTEEFDDGKNAMNIAFVISEKAESYRVMMTLFPNKQATVVVTSSQRFAIRYLGEIKALEEKSKMSR